MDATTNPLFTDAQQGVDNSLNIRESVLQIADPLALNIPDDDLERIVDKRIKDSVKFYEEKYNLKERRRKNETYLFGRQVAEMERNGKLKDYQTRSNQNVLYEIEATLKPLAMSKLPDIIITPGADDPEKEKNAEDLTKVFDDQLKQRNMRQILGLGFKHLPVYYTGIIKIRWDSEAGKFGDYRFDIIHPEYVVVDHTATSKDPDDMSYVAQCTPMTVQEAVMKWPSKKGKFFDELQRTGVMAGLEPSWRDLASEVKIWEVWFDWYKRKDKTELLTQQEMESLYEPGVKWQKVCGVLWKYEHLILDKMLDPNFDHEGTDKTYMYPNPADESSKVEVKPEDMLMMQMMGQQMPTKTEKVYNNYFDVPHKPYFFFGYDQWGKIPYDETSRIEQNLRNQENLDDQNRTILDQLKQRMKHIWSKDSGMKKQDVQRLDFEDPKMDALVEGVPGAVHEGIPPERPDQAQYKGKQDTVEAMYSSSGATAVRGQLQTDVATSNQIARESNFTRSDDLVEDTINEAAEWLARWSMQLIKLRYTEDHLKEILGPQGTMTYVSLRRDTITEGMDVMIKASSTDKLKAQRNAMQTAQLGAPFTNPLDFFKDMDMPDAEGRTERGIMFATDPQGYYAKYILSLQNTSQMAGALNAQTPGAPQAPGMAPMQPPPEQTVMGPQPQAFTSNPIDTSNVPATPPPVPNGTMH